MKPEGTFHEGEIAVQEIAGERAMAERTGRMIGETVMEAALPFLAEQQVLAAAGADADGAMWCSVWLGLPGFVRSADGTTVTIDRSRARTSAEDPVLAVVRPGHDLGLLAIELETRRRLRINGSVESMTEQAIVVRVREGFPNCPKYIHRRRLTVEAGAPAVVAAERGDTLDPARLRLVERVDTLFVGSRHAVRGADASHRGGERGFVQVLDARTIRVPDYVGNGMFQTLGNLTVDPRAGVVLVDFEAGRSLAMTGTVTVTHGAADPAGGTGRSWDFTVRRWIETALAQDFVWTPMSARTTA